MISLPGEFETQGVYETLNDVKLGVHDVVVNKLWNREIVQDLQNYYYNNKTSYDETQPEITNVSSTKIQSEFFFINKLKSD